MDLAPHIERSTTELYNYGALGVLAVVLLASAFLFFRWALQKIDQSQQQLGELQKSNQNQLEATHTMYGERIQRMHTEYTSHMEGLAQDFKQVVASNTLAMNEMKTEIRLLAEDRKWHGEDRRSGGSGQSFKGI